MVEKRKFQRFSLAAKCLLSRHDIICQGQLENISLNGALVRFEQGSVAPRDGEYDFTVYIEGEDVPFQLVVEIVCDTNGLTGIKFVSSDADTELRLGQFVGKLTSEEDKLKSEQEKIRKHLAEYLRFH